MVVKQLAASSRISDLIAKSCSASATSFLPALVIETSGGDVEKSHSHAIPIFFRAASQSYQVLGLNELNRALAPLFATTHWPDLFVPPVSDGHLSSRLPLVVRLLSLIIPDTKNPPDGDY